LNGEEKMKSIFPIFVIAALALATLACSININLPTVQTGDLEVVEINEPAASGADFTKMTLEMGAGELNISSGAQSLVEGTISYNVTDWKPEVSRDQNSLQIIQNNLEDVKLPSDEIINEWDLKLGSLPIDLTINAGAYKGTLDLSDLSLVNLFVSDGASQSEILFDTPNPVEMDHFRYETGASEVKIYNLANANVGDVSFESGAGAYTLDFSGTLQRDMSVNITSGVSTVKIIVPDGVPCKVSVSGGLNNVSPTGTWTISSNTYEIRGSGPRIDINLSMGLGNLELISR
jgi:hypothetical protein